MKAIPAADFFTGEPPHQIPMAATTPSFAEAVDRARPLPGIDYPREAATAILARENQRLGASAEALDGLESTSPGFVVSGQQAGLFGGPLYTFYKALHAVRLAARLSEESGETVLPLFWIASDDHDVDEVRSLGLRTRDGSHARVDYAPARLPENIPVGDIMLGDGITTAIDALAETLFPGDIGERYESVLRKCWRPGERWTDAFARQLLAMFSGTPLLIVDPRWEGMKRLFAPVYRIETAEPLYSTHAVNSAAESLPDAVSRKRALKKPDDTTNLFLETGGARLPLTWDGNTFHAGGTAFSKAEITALIETSPERLSPAAALRPLCQDAVFPVAATVAGPGERVYLRQAAALYDHFGVNRSLLWPRASFTVVDRKTLRTAEKESMPVEDLFNDPDRIRALVAERSFPESLEERFAALAESMERGFDAVAEGMEELDASLTGRVDKDKGRALHIVDGLKNRAIKAHKNRLSISETRLAAASAFLLPGGNLQERWYGADAILPLAGDNGIEILLPLTSPGEESHRILLME